MCHTEYIEIERGQGNTFISLIVPEEIESLEKMLELYNRGVNILDSIENKNEKLLFLTNQCHYMVHAIITGIHAKKWYLMQCRAKVEVDREKLKKIIDDMECLLFEERRNAEESIIYVSKDSRLGWEPTMGYVGDEWHIRWKIRQVNRVLETDLRNWRIAADT